MDAALPLIAFVAVFGVVVGLSRRAPRTVAHLERHRIVAVPGAGVAARRTKRPILDASARAGAAGQFAARATRREVRTKAAKVLLEAGSPMPLGTYLLLRAACTFVLMPLALLFLIERYGFSPVGLVLIGVQALSIPHLPVLYVRRKARKRARAIEHGMPDALDLLVVCVEGGLSLDGGLSQVAQRSEGVLAAEFRRLQGEIATGMGRRDAFQGLAARSQSESLTTFCSTIVQADKLGMSIGVTLRTLAATMRTRRRQAAETAARKAPIKMVPVLVFFMIPSIFIVILTPAALNIFEVFTSV